MHLRRARAAPWRRPAAAAVALALIDLPAAEADLEVTVRGARSDSGAVLISLFPPMNDFPGDGRRAVANVSARIVNGTATVVIPGVQPGGYAIAAAHDENGNGKLDTGLFGIPQEGYAFSNDATGTLGPPSFTAARFVVRDGKAAVTMTLRY